MVWSPSMSGRTEHHGHPHRPPGLAQCSPMRTQVTFDCADPHAQAAFWAQVFDSSVEDHSELVDQLIADGRMPAEDRIVVNGRSAFRDVAACRDPVGVEPRLYFQRVGSRSAWHHRQPHPSGSHRHRTQPRRWSQRRHDQELHSPRPLRHAVTSRCRVAWSALDICRNAGSVPI